MEVRLAGGVMVDLATAEDVERGHDRIAKLLERPHARFFRAFGGKTPRAANAPFIIQLQPSRPPGGMMWLVQWVATMGDDPTASTAIANVRAALFAGNIPPDGALGTGAAPAAPDFGGTLMTGIIVPSTLTVPDKSVVYSNEDLYALLAGTGTVAGAGNYRVVVGIIELPQTPEALMW